MVAPSISLCLDAGTEDCAHGFYRAEFIYSTPSCHLVPKDGFDSRPPGKEYTSNSLSGAAANPRSVMSHAKIFCRFGKCKPSVSSRWTVCGLVAAYINGRPARENKGTSNTFSLHNYPERGRSWTFLGKISACLGYNHAQRLKISCKAGSH